MASKSRIEQLMGKAILDPAFRKLVLSDPDAAAKQIRTSLTAAQRAGIKNLDKNALAKWAKSFDTILAEKHSFFW